MRISQNKTLVLDAAYIGETEKLASLVQIILVIKVAELIECPI